MAAFAPVIAANHPRPDGDNVTVRLSCASKASSRRRSQSLWNFGEGLRGEEYGIQAIATSSRSGRPTPRRSAAARSGQTAQAPQR